MFYLSAQLKMLAGIAADEIPGKLRHYSPLLINGELATLSIPIINGVMVSFMDPGAHGMYRYRLNVAGGDIKKVEKVFELLADAILLWLPTSGTIILRTPHGEVEVPWPPTRQYYSWRWV